MLGFICVATLGFQSAFAQVSETNPTPDGPLPEIRARMYPVSVVRASKSGQVYLFNDPNEARPFPGRILLVKKDRQQLMAFRVLRTYSDSRQFAAKVVRRYPEIEILPTEEAFSGIEKISDMTPPPPTSQDRADLKELEAGLESPPGASAIPPTAGIGARPQTVDYDPELDAGTSPALSGAVDSDLEKADPSIDDGDGEDSFDDDADGEMVIEEVLPLDHFRSALSVQFGMMTNFNQSNEVELFGFRGAGLRYALTLGKMVFLKRAHLQDSLAAEGGFFAYQARFYTDAGVGVYSVTPLMASLRYTINFANKFGIFGYAGIMANRILSDVGGNDSDRAALNSTVSSAGLGALAAIGPGWDLRLDLGIDMLGLGLMLRF